MIDEILERVEEKLSEKQSIEDVVDEAIDEVVDDYLSDTIPGWNIDEADVEEWDPDWLRFVNELKNNRR